MGEGTYKICGVRVMPHGITFNHILWKLAIIQKLLRKNKQTFREQVLFCGAVFTFGK